ncbi:MAG: M16 family metallopeptidase [Bacteroidales bacterium]
MKIYSALPKILKIVDIQIPTVETQNLSGVPCSIVRGSSQPLIKLDVSFAAGEAYNENPLVALLTNQMLLESTQKHTAQEIAEQLDLLGIELFPSNGMVYSTFSMICLTKHFEKAWNILIEMLTEPKFYETDLQILIENERKQFLIGLENVNNLARRYFRQAVFGKNHPYGRLYNLEDFNNISSKQLIEHYQRLYNKDNLRIFISGDVMNEHLKIMEKNFRFSNSTSTRPPIPTNFESLPQKIYIEKEKAVQSAIRIGKLTIPKHHPDYHSLQIAIAILGGYFGSKLMQELRERKGYTYGIGAFTVSLKETGYVVITTEVNSNVTKQALESIYEVIDHFCNNPITEEELENARAYLMGEFLRFFDGAFNIMEAYKAMNDLDLGMEQYAQFLQKLKQIEPYEILSVAQRYLSNGYSEVVVGQMNL